MKQRTTTILYVSAFVAFALILSYGVAYSNFLNINTTVISTDASLRDAMSAKDKLISLQKTISGSKADIQKINGMFVSNDGVAGFLQQVESIANTSGLSHSLSPDIQQDGDLSPYQQELLKVTLTTTGSWVGTLRFLNLLENLPYKIAFTSISIQAGDKTKNGNAVWTSNFQFTVVKNK